MEKNELYSAPGGWESHHANCIPVYWRSVIRGETNWQTWEFNRKRSGKKSHQGDEINAPSGNENLFPLLPPRRVVYLVKNIPPLNFRISSSKSFKSRVFSGEKMRNFQTNFGRNIFIFLQLFYFAVLYFLYFFSKFYSYYLLTYSILYYFMPNFSFSLFYFLLFIFIIPYSIMFHFVDLNYSSFDK